MPETPFLGPFSVSRSRNFSDNVLINLFPEIIETKDGKAPGVFYMTPGLDLLASVGVGPIRGSAVMAGNLYAVSGYEVYELTTAYVPTLLGSILTTSGPVSIIQNGTQLDIFDGEAGYMVGASYSATAAAPTSEIGINVTASYAPADIVTVAGGTFTTPAQLTIDTTQLASATVVDGGTGGVDGSAQATGRITVAVNPAAGVTLTPFGTVITFVASGASGNQVNIGGSAGATQTALQAFLAGSMDPNLVKATYVNSGGHITATAVTAGSAGNTLTLATSNATDITLSGPTLTGGIDPQPVILTGTTGSGTKFQIQGNLLSGVVVSLGAIVTGGAYTINPSILTDEPVTGGSVTGCVLSLIMGPNQTAVSVAGVYSTVPPNPVSQSAGNGVGGLWNLTFTNSTALLQLDLPFSGPVSATYQDGFGLVNEVGTDTWWQSDLGDLSTWEPLNFSSADSRPDGIVSIFSIHREVFLLKDNETEVWINAGLNGFAFQRLEGVYPEVGTVAAFSVAKVGESLMFLSQTGEGSGMVMRTQGYQARKVSTHAIDYQIQQFSKISDAVAFTYQIEGHSFYVLSFPTGNATFVYDATTSDLAGIPMWHQRSAFSNGNFLRWWAANHTFFNGQHVVGDYRNGNLYALNMNTALDNGAQRKWVRSWRANQQAPNQTQRFNCLTIQMQTGDGVAPNANPQIVLDWSDDGGHSWSPEMFRSAGLTGQTAIRVQFRRLGSTKRTHGLDRIFRLSSTDVFTVGLTGAVLD